MSFTENLQQKLMNLEISSKDHTVYTEDADALLNHVIEELKEKDPSFAEVFVGLSLCGSYLDQVKLDVPDEFDLHLKLKFPFKVTPKSNNSEFVSLCAEFEPMLLKFDIEGADLQHWLHSVFKKVFSSDLILSCNGKKYTLSYRMGTYGCAHTIKAVSKDRALSIDLVPAFEFTGSQWPFADPPVPQKVRNAYPWLATALLGVNKTGKSFIVSAPMWENALIKDNHKLKDVLRLMKGLRDANRKQLPELSSYMMKTVLLHRAATVDWKRDLGELFVEMWGHLIKHLWNGKLEVFLTRNGNLLSQMHPQSQKKCLATAEDLLKSLKEAKLAVDKFDKVFTEK
ncbi:cyclic GMP-AMP synthase-like protein [Drosophila kikkawai]|uniref:Cyclic GMP-AMP synthase-like protein n=1 Tax=Drosophila kikkawai TaxID=30033 RepID=A0A6P4J922_DROKI|nr:uncharacterized protein LOC108080761 [Drosophila kikkawai]